MNRHKPTIAVDFDGVVHQYVSPWTSPVDIHDPPVPGALDFLRRLIGSGWRVIIHTARLMNNGPSAGTDVPEMGLIPRVQAIREWFRAHDAQDVELAVSFWTAGGKPHADVYLDDRALRFDGVWPSDEVLADAKVPWNRRSQSPETTAPKVERDPRSGERDPRRDPRAGDRIKTTDGFIYEVLAVRPGEVIARLTRTWGGRSRTNSYTVDEWYNPDDQVLYAAPETPSGDQGESP